MTVPQATAGILLLSTAVLLNSCIDGREEFWIEADGSGRAEITYTLPAGAGRTLGGENNLRDTITRVLKDTPGITSSVCEVFTGNEHLRMKVSASFDTSGDSEDFATSLATAHLPAAVSPFVGNATTTVQGTTLDFSRTITPGNALPGMRFLPTSQLENHHLVYIVHLPFPAVSSNATRTENNGRTLVWDYPLAQAVKAPVTTRLRVSLPFPWKWMSAIAVPVLLIGGLAFRRILKSRA